MSGSFEHTDKAIYYFSGKSRAQNGKIYEILDRRYIDGFEEFKIEPGWYSRTSFNPYYDVEEGDILVATSRGYMGRRIYSEPGKEYQVYSVTIGCRGHQRIVVMTEGGRRRAKHRLFKPAQITLKQKVDLI